MITSWNIRIVIIVAACTIKTGAFRLPTHGVGSCWSAHDVECSSLRRFSCLIMKQQMAFKSRCSTSGEIESLPDSTAPLDDSLINRRRAIALGLSGMVGGLTVAARSSFALDPLRKTQELWRIWNQQEADNVLGGELASPEGGKTIQPVLTLIPIVTLRLKLDTVEANLKDPSRFGDALATLRSEDFEKKNIKRVFNAYSDNIYYLPGSERENKYLQGGATPSSRQTLQYLLRNDIIDNVDALAAEVAYLIREREVTQAGRGEGGADLDETDLRVYLAKCKGSFDRYLGMVFQNEIDEATAYAKMALKSGKIK